MKSYQSMKIGSRLSLLMDVKMKRETDQYRRLIKKCIKDVWLQHVAIFFLLLLRIL